MKGLDWKSLFYAFLGFLAPLIYEEILKGDPSFPLPSTMFTDLIIHLIGYLIGGWNLAKAAIKHDYFVRNK